MLSVIDNIIRMLLVSIHMVLYVSVFCLCVIWMLLVFYTLTPRSQVGVGSPWASYIGGCNRNHTPRPIRPPRHATMTMLRVQHKHNVATWPPHVPKRHTARQESVPMLTNNGKRYKRKHSHATALQTANMPPKNA